MTLRQAFAGVLPASCHNLAGEAASGRNGILTLRNAGRL